MVDTKATASEQTNSIPALASAEARIAQASLELRRLDYYALLTRKVAGANGQTDVVYCESKEPLIDLCRAAMLAPAHINAYAIADICMHSPSGPQVLHTITYERV